METVIDRFRSEERLDIVTREDGTDMIAFPTKEAKAAFQTNLLHTLKSFREKDISGNVIIATAVAVFPGP
jgi:hypothetical protein